MATRIVLRLVAICCVVFWGCRFLGNDCLGQDTTIRFEDLSQSSQIDFIHDNGSSGRHYLIEAVAAGMASFDYDNDGDIDLYFVNGAALPGAARSRPPTNQLWRNQGQFKFEKPSGTYSEDRGYGLGVTVGDVDNDGFADIYLSNLNQNELLLNNGDGTFTKSVDETLACGDRAGGGPCMLDADGDGNLDIYVANYVDFNFDIQATKFRGRTVYGGPLLYDKLPDNFLLNQGDGTFVDYSQASGIDENREWGMGVVCFDFDADGDTDIFVANDSTRNLLYENDGSGSFFDIALLAGVAYDHRGDPQGSMGADVADYDGDLRLDVFQTAYTKQLATLYRNLGDAVLEDATLRTGAGKGTFYYVNWGTGFIDLDNDGDKDLFIANGHIHDNMDDLDDTVSYRLPNQVMQNEDGRFRDVSEQVGDVFQIEASSRGCILDDLDNDGRVDIVVLNSLAKPTVMRNTSKPQNWIQFQLAGTSSNREAVGSQVIITAGDKSQILEVHSGRGYQSHFGSRLHFGLGSAKTVEKVEVRWHGAQPQVFSDLAANRIYTLIQGQPPESSAEVEIQK